VNRKLVVFVPPDSLEAVHEEPAFDVYERVS
jgi:hypothetical protein